VKLSIAQATPAEVLRYDYSVIEDDGDRNAVMGAAMAIKPLVRRVAEDLIQIGQELIAVKDFLPHGQFTPWIETEFGLHPRTARRMMAVAERLGHKADTLSDLSASVLYELAADSTPAETVDRVVRLTGSGESLTTREVRSLATLPPAKTVYWQPEPAQANGTHEAQPEAPTLPTQADRGLTVEQTVAMIEQAMAEQTDAPELEMYHGAKWAIYLADTYGFWPIVDTAKRAIAEIVRKIPKPAPAQKALDQSDTEAVIDRVLAKDFTTDTQRLAYLDKAGPNAYTHALRPGVYINSETFDAARAAIRAEISERIAKEQAKAEAEAQRRQEAARVEAVRHDKQTMLYGLRRALAELPESAEDGYYDLTGTTLYSTARQAVTNAIKELENTMEAERV
jgi:chaperonin cofactor prefoldin